jgi:hypothetical protein
MSFLVNYQSNWSRDGLCTHICVRRASPKANFLGMIRGQVNLESVSKAGKTSIKQSKNSVFTCEIMYAIF